MRRDRIMRDGGRGANLQGGGDALGTDLRQHFEIGVVTAEQGDSHFTIEDGDIWVDVSLVPTGQPVTCRMSSIAGGPGRGVWMVPANGSEVCVAFPNGTIEGGGIIIANLSTANLPEGVAEDQIVIVAPKVLVYNSDSADADPLPTLAEFRGHTHQTGMGPSTPTTDPIPGVGLITGTLVLESE